MRHYRFPCGCEWPIIEENTPTDCLPLMDFNVEEAPENCPATWALLGRGETKGVFQLESNLGKQWTRKLKPENAEHITALGALLRPGCLAALDEEGVSMTQHYCRRKNGEEDVKAYHPAVDSILFPTYGVLAYQEQAMYLCVAVAGFNEMEADMLRKAIGKKLPEEMAKVKLMFIQGAKNTGVLTEAQAEEVFGWIEKSQRYSFNKCSHRSTIIRRPTRDKHHKRIGYSVEEMYKIRTSLKYAKETGHEQLRRKWNRLGHYGFGLSMCEDGRIRPNIIRDIQFSGKLPIYRVGLSNGAYVLVTGNHKFPTTDGVMTVDQMADAKEPVFVFVCGKYEVSDFKKMCRFSDVTNQERLVQSGSSGRGCFGESNRWFTNGSFTSFRQNGLLIPKKCGECGTTEKRLELHHRNRNRADSSLKNLARLCSSCHKKADYAMGRVRKGEKGYPAIASQVVSISFEFVDDAYDVTMDGPNHNFIVGESDIVTCNSHACCYGLTGYECAYIKAHFPLSFFAAWLREAGNKQDPQQEIFELVNDAKLFDVVVEPPDLRLMNARFETDRRVIKFGIGDIKGVGGAQVQKLTKAVEDVEVSMGKKLGAMNWYEFLVHCSDKLSSSVVERLIQVGAVRWFGPTRQRMLVEYRAWKSLTDKEQGWIIEQEKGKSFGSLEVALEAVGHPKKEGGGCANKNRVETVKSHTSLLKCPPSSLDDSPNWIAWVEEDLLGISISCSKVDSCDLSQVNVSCKEYLAGRTGYLMFGVEVQQVRVVKTKKGKTPGSKMAFLTLSDGSCSLEDVVVFPDAWKEYSYLLTEGNTVIIQGERDNKKDSNTLMVKKVWQASQAVTNTAA